METRREDKANVAVEDRFGKLRLRLPNSVADRRYLTLGLDTTPLNQATAQQIAEQIKLDIMSGNLDRTLAKYDRRKNISTPTPTPAHTLQSLFAAYVGATSSKLEENTKANYQTFTNYLNRCPISAINDAQAVRKWIESELPKESGLRLVKRLHTACQWGVKQGFLDSSPYDGMAEDMKPKRKQQEDTADPFTATERNLIIEAYENHAYYRMYAPIISFLFYTGCRTSEAIGLRWRNVDLDKGTIKINEATVKVQGKKHQKGTKTGKARKFTVSERVLHILMKECVIPVDPESFVFLVRGKQVDHTLLHRSWFGRDGKNGIVTGLVCSGELTNYRSLYNTRHTFATLALMEGKLPITEVAFLLGNTTAICESTYVKPYYSLKLPDL